MTAHATHPHGSFNPKETIQLERARRHKVTGAVLDLLKRSAENGLQLWLPQSPQHEAGLTVIGGSALYPLPLFEAVFLICAFQKNFRAVSFYCSPRCNFLSLPGECILINVQWTNRLKWINELILDFQHHVQVCFKLMATMSRKCSPSWGFIS